MKQESSPVFDRVVQEVARIIFGDHNLTELNVRLGRMALERHNVHEIVKQPPAA